MYDAALFDMDGVILRGLETPRSRYERAAGQVLRDNGLPPDHELREVLVDADPQDVETLRRTIAHHDFDPDALWSQRESVASELANAAIDRGERRLYPDVEVLDALDRPIGMVSNNRHATVTHVAEKTGLSFDVVRGRDPTLQGYARLKPDPYYLQDALDRLDAKRPVYVGDRLTDVRAAARADINGILLDRPEGDSIPEHSDVETTITSLKDLRHLVTRRIS